jgi:hypothetical protein
MKNYFGLLLLTCFVFGNTIFLNSAEKKVFLQINTPGSVQANDTTVLNDTIPVNDTIASAIAGEKAAAEAAARAEAEAAAKAEAEKAAMAIAKEPVPSNWHSGGQTALNFSQISLSNWAAGGQNSLSFNSRLNSFLNYKTPDNVITWENTLDLRYGLINQENRGTVKSDDRIDFSTKFGRRASEYWAYSSLINFRTQFAPGYKSPGDTDYISAFMAPAYLNISIGMDHKFDENISFYLSPLAGRITYVLDEGLSAAGAFGVEPGENKRKEFGGFIRALFRATLMENITANSKLELFSNYLEKPQNLNINFDTRIIMQINQYISANLEIQMLYDENATIRVTDAEGNIVTLGPRVQLKQTFSLGFSYRF